MKEARPLYSVSEGRYISGDLSHMKVECPYCKGETELPIEPQIGQNVKCKYCERKFAYGVETPKPTRIDIPLGSGRNGKKEKADLHIRRKAKSSGEQSATSDGGAAVPPPPLPDSELTGAFVPAEGEGLESHPDEKYFPRVAKMLFWTVAVPLIASAVFTLIFSLLALPGPTPVLNRCSVDISTEPNIQKSLDEDFDLYKDYYLKEDREFAQSYISNGRYLHDDYEVVTTLIGDACYSRWSIFLSLQVLLFIGLLSLWFFRGFALVVYGIFRNGRDTLTGLGVVAAQNEKLRANNLQAGQYVCDRLAEVCDSLKGV